MILLIIKTPPLKLQYYKTRQLRLRQHKKLETPCDMKIPERDVTYMVLFVHLLTLTSPIRHTWIIPNI